MKNININIKLFFNITLLFLLTSCVSAYNFNSEIEEGIIECNKRRAKKLNESFKSRGLDTAEYKGGYLFLLYDHLEYARLKKKEINQILGKF